MRVHQQNVVQLFQITETFEMETQPQLLLLQKTMVTAEGVAQSLHKKINFWEVAHPTVEEWMRDNMGPEAKAAQVVSDGLTFLKKLPHLVSKADKLLNRLEEQRFGGQKNPNQKDTHNEKTQGIRNLYLVAGIALGMTATYILTQIL